MPAPAQTALPAEDAPDTGGPSRDAVVSVDGCTGVLIAPDVVLTSGHCTPGRPRLPRPDGVDLHACTGLEQQSRMQKAPWEDPGRWHPYSTATTVRFGPDRTAPTHVARTAGYALPRCADLGLLRLAEPVPPEIARPLPVLTAAPHRAGTLPETLALRHAGWGGSHLRRTGPVGFWGASRCALVALGPRRADGQRLVSGDSGAPLLMTLQGASGPEEVVAGIAFIRGQADTETCGVVRPPAPPGHGSWTPTFRPAIAGTEATPIGDWLRALVPQADHR